MGDTRLILSVPKFYFSGVASVLSSGRLMMLFGAQLLLGLVTYVVVAWLSFHYRNDMTAWITGNVDSFWEQLLAFVLFLVALVLNGVLTYFVMMILGGFLMEWFVQTMLRNNGVPLDEELSWQSIKRMIVRTVKVSALRILAGIVVIVLSLASFAFPLIGPVTSVLVVCLVGFDFLELCVSVTSHEVRSRIRLVDDHKALILFFGAIATLLLAIPFIGILFVPVVAGAAAHVVTKLAAAKPS